MGFHHEHSHGRVFRGLEARNMLEMEKRDSHGSHIKMNVPPEDNKMRFIHNLPGNFQEKAQTVATVESVVYVTEAKTFPGPALYVTDGAATTTANAVAGTTNTDVAAAQSTLNAQESYALAKSLANNPHPQASSSTALTHAKGSPLQRTRATETSSSLQTNPPQFTRHSAAAISSSATIGAGAVGGSPLHASHGATAVGGSPLAATRSAKAELISKKSDGMSSGGKAGLAFGIIIAIALAAGLVFFCWRRRKNQRSNDGHQQIMDEKHASQNSFFGGTAAAVGAPAGNYRGSTATNRTASTAPRLSLRPVTQFLPGFAGTESRKSTGNALDVPAMSEKPKSAWERRLLGAQQNPFDDTADFNEKHGRSVSPPSNPFDEGDGAFANDKSTPSHSAKSSWEGSEPPTPKSTKFGTASAVPITAAGAVQGGPPMPRGPNNVHRVQLDFKPSMEDELELRSGQLVRMLHEYDDGWVSQPPPGILRTFTDMV